MFSACSLYILTSYSLPPTAIWCTLFTLGNWSSEACGHLCPYGRPLLPCKRSLGSVGSPLGLHVLWPHCRSSCRLPILSWACSVFLFLRTWIYTLSSPTTASVSSLVLIPSQHMSAQPVLWDLSTFEPVPTRCFPGDHRQLSLFTVIVP